MASGAVVSALALLRCASFSGSSTDDAPKAVDATTEGDVGLISADGGASGDAGASDASTPCADLGGTVLLCEDFDGVDFPDPRFGVDLNKGAVTRVDGGRSAPFAVQSASLENNAQAVSARYQLTTPLPVPASAKRIQFRVSLKLPDPTGNFEVELFRVVPQNVVKPPTFFLVFDKGQSKVSLWLGRVGVGTDDVQLNPDDSFIAYPRDTWFTVDVTYEIGTKITYQLAGTTKVASVAPVLLDAGTTALSVQPAVGIEYSSSGQPSIAFDDLGLSVAP
jgi:hypothetical protein